MRQHILLGEREFHTKTQAEHYVRELLKKIGICNSVKSKSISNFLELSSILKQHPHQCEKLHNMIDIAIIPNKLNKTTLEVNIIKEDGTLEDISWKMCVTQREKSYNHLLLTAMRYSITYQIDEYRSRSLMKCVFCHKTDTLMHVDHITHFISIARDFMNTANHSLPTEFEDTEDDSNRKRFKDINGEFEKDWNLFHQEKAQLRILCATCNLKREKHIK